MSEAELILDLGRLGIQLEADGERLRFFPRSALTPDLLARLKSHKAALLAMLRPTTEVAGIDRTGVAAVWQAALDRLEGNSLFPPDEMEALRAADVRWADDFPPVSEPLDSAGWPTDCIDPNELTPCPKCGTLELWQSVAGDLFGLAPGRWRCVKCDPPTTARRLVEAKKRIRRRMNGRNATRQIG